MSSATVKMSSGGRLVIPVAMRRELGLEAGVVVRLNVENATLSVKSVSATMAHAKALVAQYVPKNVSLVDELIADRRAEAAAEDK